MVNIVWFGLLSIGIITAAFTGRIEVITNVALTSAKSAVTIAIELIGIMALWLGLLRIAEDAGIINYVARVVRPFTRILFPSIPRNHPAMGAIIMNISANILGLGNAATPLGLKAMQELQSLNDNSDEASEAMCTFLAINTSCITLLPATIIGIRLAAGSAAPTEIVGTTIFATTCGMTIAIISDFIFRRTYRNRRK